MDNQLYMQGAITCIGFPTCTRLLPAAGPLPAEGLLSTQGLSPAQGQLPAMGLCTHKGLLPASVPCSSCGWWLWRCRHSRCRAGCCLGRRHRLMGWGLGAGGSCDCRWVGCGDKESGSPKDLRINNLSISCEQRYLCRKLHLTGTR